MENTSSTDATRYSDAELEEFRLLVNEKLEKARTELVFMQSQLSEMSENTNNKNSGDLFDDSSLHTEIEMMSRMISRQQHFVQNLEAALFRIRNKSYGICAITGKLISKQRLLLVPHATKSVLGKEEEKKLQAKEPFKGAYAGQNPLKDELGGGED